MGIVALAVGVVCWGVAPVLIRRLTPFVDAWTANGLRYPYTGNVHDTSGDTTFCHVCQEALIVRDWYEMKDWNLAEKSRCARCGTRVSGRFEAKPGTWGSRRLPVSIF